MSLLKEAFSPLLLGATLYILALLFGYAAQATESEPDVYDLWNACEEFEEISDLRALLLENDWIWSEVSIQDLDYILVLVQQLNAEFLPNVPVSIILAQISVESGFRSDLVGFNNDTGLMQVIPRWHGERIEKYIYDENVDLTDPRLNVMVGMDYLDELLVNAEGDISLALMMYNQGPASGRRSYARSGESSYAEMVLERAYLINDILERR